MSDWITDITIPKSYWALNDWKTSIRNCSAHYSFNFPADLCTSKSLRRNSTRKSLRFLHHSFILVHHRWMDIPVQYSKKGCSQFRKCLQRIKASWLWSTLESEYNVNIYLLKYPQYVSQTKRSALSVCKTTNLWMNIHSLMCVQNLRDNLRCIERFSYPKCIKKFCIRNRKLP